MDNLFKNQGVERDTMMGDLKRSLDESKSVYWQRMCGMTHLWSATTKCIHCGEYWMWGVKDNLAFVCDKCKRNDSDRKS